MKPVQPWLVIEGPRSASQVTWDYTVLGVEHILSGFDPLLFVLTMLMFNVGVELGLVIFVMLMLGLINLLRQLRNEWPAIHCGPHLPLAA